MPEIPVIAIFDIGKTNKKLFLFDQDYTIVFERSAQLAETTDEDGFPCENIESLRAFIFDSLKEAFNQKQFVIKAINFSTYGASFVYIDNEGKSLTPLYNYLKPYPEDLKEKFYQTYGDNGNISLVTSSPVLDSLNSGLQVYRLKYEKPELFKKVKYALHLPQYLSFLFTGQACSDLTSIGCHTSLWDFQINDYHKWVYNEQLDKVFAQVVACDKTYPSAFASNTLLTGVGIHDSSAALTPYLLNFSDPFVLISTGTWCITLNPFNNQPLTKDELENDCLCYLTYQGKPVKASRLFSGYEHEEQVKRIAAHFNSDVEKYKTVEFDPRIVSELELNVRESAGQNNIGLLKGSLFGTRDLNSFTSYEAAYHQLMSDLVTQQIQSTELVLNGTNVKRIFVDGGFSKNPVFMNLLASAYSDISVFAASVSQASSIGAALLLHNEWNQRPVPDNIISLRYYSIVQEGSL